MKFRINAITLTAVCIVAGAPLIAQVTTGSLVGTVRDRDGKVIPGVTIIASSPNLMSNRTTRSDAQGNWQMALLPPGEYKVVFSLSGYNGSSISNIRVGIDTVQRADARLTPLSVASATVEITADQAVLIDKNDTKVGSNYSYEQLFAMPVGTSPAGAASLTAGAISSGGGYSLRGGSIYSTLYRLNGVDVKNDYEGGMTGTVYLSDMVEDIEVNLSPIHPKHGRSSGGAMNIVTKSGSNTLSGSIRATNLSRNSWSANKSGLIEADFAGNRFDDSTSREYHATLLGPIIKDKLWFSFGTRIVPNQRNPRRIVGYGGSNPQNYDGPMRIVFSGGSGSGYTRDLDALNQKMYDGPDGYALTYFDELEYYMSENKTTFYEYKLTYTLMNNHTFELSQSYENITVTNNAATAHSGSNLIMLSMLGDIERERKYMGINYKGIFGHSTFVEARYNTARTDDGYNAYVHPTIQHPVTHYNGLVNGNQGYNVHGYAFTSPNDPAGADMQGNTTWNINVKQYWYGLGSHEADIGLEQYKGRLHKKTGFGPDDERITVGGGIYLKNGQHHNDPNADFLFGTIVHPAIQGNTTGGNLWGMNSQGLIGPAMVKRNYWGIDGEQNPITTSFYAGDLWNINDHWTIMYGARYDQYKINNTDGSQLASSSQFIPRAMVKYDPTGDTKHLLSLSYAMFTDDFFTGFTDSFTNSKMNQWTAMGWTGQGLSSGPQPWINSALGANQNMDAVQFVSYSDILNPLNWQYNGQWNIFAFNSDEVNVVDPDFKPPIAHEWSFRYQRQFEDNSVFSVSATQKTWERRWAIKQDWHPDNWVLVTDPLGSGRSVWTQVITYTNSDNLKRDYYGIEVDYKHVINNTWTVQSVVGYSALKGNDEDITPSASAARDGGSNPYYYNRELILGSTPPALSGRTEWVEDDFAPYGYLSSHQLMKARVTLSGRFPLSKGGHLTWVLLGRYDTGSRLSLTRQVPPGAHNIPSELFPSGAAPASNGWFVRYYIPRGEWTTNDNFNCDMNFSWQVPLGVGGLSVFGYFRVNNLFNNMRLTSLSRTQFSSTSRHLPTVDNYDTYMTTRPGTDQEKGYYNSARSADFSIGLRF
ncbi:MAG: TonB-dependent receptor [Holophagaceae bacterium]|nr:TonB-dependent receptor [Holophagaceae bacterium]